MKKAQEMGKHIGRPKAIKIPEYEDIMIAYQRKEITGIKAIELLGTNRNTFYKWVKEDNFTRKN